MNTRDYQTLQLDTNYSKETACSKKVSNITLSNKLK